MRSSIGYRGGNTAAGCRQWVLLSVVAVVASAVLLSSTGIAGETRGTGTSLFEATAQVAELDRMESFYERHASAVSQNGESSCPSLAIFYDSTCGHCRTMAPRISSFSEVASNDAQLSFLFIGAVNCATQLDECRLKNVSDVPTMFLVLPSLFKGDTTQKTTDLQWHLLPTVSSREELHQAVAAALMPFSVRLSPNQRDVCSSVVSFWRQEKQRWIDDEEELRKRESAESSSSTAVDSDKKKKKQDGGGGTKKVLFVEERALHAVDIAASFFYTMYHEVSMMTLDKKTRQPLRHFLSHVAVGLPGLKADALVALLNAKVDEPIIGAVEWRQAVTDAGIPFRGTVSHPEWNTCRGSSWKYRGFTCGLWLLYHAMTINVAHDDEGMERLGAIRAFVLSFFACGDCRSHFSQFKWLRPKAHRFHWSPMTQLWAAHNQVNQRLCAERDGIDPLVPKRLFPDAVLCADCINKGADLTQILREDNQTKNEERMMELYRVPAVESFLRGRFAWEVISKEFLDEAAGCGDDTCPLPPWTTKATAAVGGGATTAPSSGGIWFQKTRHPDYVVPRDSLIVHVLFTLVAVGVSIGAGFFYIRNRAGGGGAAMGKGSVIYRRSRYSTVI